MLYIYMPCTYDQAAVLSMLSSFILYTLQ